MVFRRLVMLVDDMFTEWAIRIENVYYSTEDPERAERLFQIEQERDAADVTKGTEHVGAIETLLGELTREFEKTRLDLEEAEDKVKHLLAEGRDETDPEVATWVKIAAMGERNVADLEKRAQKALGLKKTTMAYVRSLELARKLAAAEDKVTLVQARANMVERMMMEHEMETAELGQVSKRRRSSIRHRLRTQTLRAHDKLRGQREAVQMVLQMRGEAAVAEQTRLTKKEQVVFARLQREAAAETGVPAAEVARTAVS